MMNYVSTYALVVLTLGIEMTVAFMPATPHTTSAHQEQRQSQSLKYLLATNTGNDQLLLHTPSNNSSNTLDAATNSKTEIPKNSDLYSETVASSSSESSSSTTSPEFGQSVPLRFRPAPTLPAPPRTAQFGEVVPLRPPVTVSEKAIIEPSTAQQMIKRNIVVAIVSILLAVGNYVWEFQHPTPPLQLLASMQQASAPLSVIGKNDKPSVVDFWAPWCDNCQYMAATLKQVEDEFRDQVNFVMVNGDQAASWPAIEAFGVDAIPHLALVSADGYVETALIGPVPKTVLEADIHVMLQNAKLSNSASSDAALAVAKQDLPYKMLDVFANAPEKRKLSFND
jgi:thiol-disulfide isomerase/thioredoxin